MEKKIELDSYNYVKNHKKSLFDFYINYDYNEENLLNKLK